MLHSKHTKQRQNYMYSNAAPYFGINTLIQIYYLVAVKRLVFIHEKLCERYFKEFTILFLMTVN